MDLNEMAVYLAKHSILLGIAAKADGKGGHVYQATLSERDGRPMGIGLDADLTKAVAAAIADSGGMY